MSCARQLPIEKLVQVLEKYVQAHPELPDGLETRFWVFDYSTRRSREGALDAFRQLEWVIGEIGHTVLVLEPWEDPYALRRALCILELVHTHRQGTVISRGLWQVSK